MFVEKAASRLNLAQSFNGLGCILAPVIVGGFLFSGGSGGVEVPYTIMGVIVLVAALVFSRVSLSRVTATAPATVINAQMRSTFSALMRLMIALPATLATMNRPKAPNERTNDAVALSIQPSEVA